MRALTSDFGRKGIVALLSAFALASPATAVTTPRAVQGHAVREQADRRPDSDLDSRRERWSRMSAEERETLRLRYENLRRMPSERREELQRRARHLKRIGESLSEEVRLDLEGLSPEKRRERWRSHMLHRSREEGRRLREELPPRVRERLEKASPEERRRMLEGMHADVDGRSRRAIQWMGRRLRLTPETVAELEALPVERRLKTMLELRRRLVEEGVEQNGLPRGLDRAAWDELRRLSDDEEFFRRLPGRGFERRAARQSRDRRHESSQDGRRRRHRADDADAQEP